MEGLRHPITFDIYEKESEGVVLVTTKRGRRGRYRLDGTWIDGDRFSADIHMCSWVGGVRRRHPLNPSPSSEDVRAPFAS